MVQILSSIILNDSTRYYRRGILHLQRIIHRHASQQKSQEHVELKRKYEDIPVSNIRNFSIIAHIDHGKSTLADRLLELTGTIDSDAENHQVLDRLQVEKERGITVKAVTASLQYTSTITNEDYLLNLVDTPGHVDFANEVSRALSACQAVILLVDANQGVQAQTYSNFYLAFGKDLVVVPVLNKIDLKNAKPEEVEDQLQKLFDIDKKEVLRISAKHGTGVENLLEHIVDVVPPPPVNRDAPFKGLLFDSWYQAYAGVIIMIYVKDGQVKPGDVIVSHQTGNSYTVKDVGILRPSEFKTEVLKAGQVGYISCNMRSGALALIGDTYHLKDQPVEPFPTYKPAQPMVFAGLYPADPNDSNALRTALEKLLLTDSAVTMSTDTSPALGHGWRLGFLGLLHMEVFNQRLDQEYDAQTIMTAPSVTYKVQIKGQKNIKEYGSENLVISNPTKLPSSQAIVEMQEPLVLGTIIVPNEYLNAVTALCVEKRGEEKSVVTVDSNRSMLQYILPLNEILIDFFDKLKNKSSGYASFDYEDYGYRPSDLTKLDFLLNSKPVEELSMIVHKSRAREVGREICEKLTEVIPRQQFKIAVQAAVGTKILARENINPYRKDVVGKRHGGDATRKMKVLARQADAKRKMRMVGDVQIPRDSFIQLLKQY